MTRWKDGEVPAALGLMENVIGLPANIEPDVKSICFAIFDLVLNVKRYLLTFCSTSETKSETTLQPAASDGVILMLNIVSV